MHAHDRFLPEWFNRIRARQITLPRFQRFEAWGHQEVTGLLTMLLRGLPAGATLILEVGDAEKFRSRTMVDAPQTGDKVTEQLLDGQQRLTALWRSLHDKHPDRTYLVGFDDDPHHPGKQLPSARGQARWTKNGTRYPVWVDDPRQCWARNLIPLRLLRPDDIKGEIDAWIEAAMPEDVADKYTAYKTLSAVINDLRTKVREFNLPYLALPPQTEKDVALDVFVKMNTSSVQLTTYDIIVALVESETGKSLHEHVDLLAQSVPRAGCYADLPSLVLDVVALRQDRIPSQAGYQGIDFDKMLKEWDLVVAGVRGMAQFLEEESLFDEARLPSYTTLPVLASLWEHMPTQPDRLGNARLLLRKYLWRSFLTERYEQSSASNALQDYRGLKQMLTTSAPGASAPIFDEDLYPVPTKNVILMAPWPKSKTILGRGLLALQIKCGAEDPADGARASATVLASTEHRREYHHLFPDAILSDAAFDPDDIFLAVNCALVTWRTNRTISAKSPLSYLKERADRSDLGESELRRRLRTHLIPYDELNVGPYDAPSDPEQRARIETDYQRFREARAALLQKAAVKACAGVPLDINEIFSGST